MATHTVWGQMAPRVAPVALFTGSQAECRFELAKAGRGSWALLTILPVGEVLAAVA